ncbi:MAG: metal-binding protein [Microcystaceae cyanobacterium]
MPSGKTHDRITWSTLPWVICITSLLIPQWHIILIVGASFLFAGFMFGPDLDIYSIQYQRWGILQFIWNPYQKLIPHRSLFSHGFLIGTIIRVVYLVGVILILMGFIAMIGHLVSGGRGLLADFEPKLFQSMIKQYATEALALLIGLEVGAMSHSIADHLDSAAKKRQSKKLKPKKARKKRKATSKSRK